MESLKDSGSKIETMSVIPVILATALGHMQRSIACPEDVKARIAALKIPVEDAPGRMSTNWRSGGGSGSGSSTGRPGPGGHGPGGYGPGGHGPGGYGHGRWGGGGGGGGHRRPEGSTSRVPMAAPRFGNRARKDAEVEDRMMDRIRDKLNKFSSITYDITKSWLCQLLNSGETEFLTGFITMVFEKAASEPHICALYARLITELRASFPHLDTELHRIFDEFILIFEEARVEPDIGTAQYTAFVEQRERRKYRRGYAGFIGEVASLGVLSAADVITTCNKVLDGIITAKVTDGNQGLCEEYASCLTILTKRCGALILPSSADLAKRVKDAMDRTDAPGLSNKARFALMDIMDMFA